MGIIRRLSTCSRPFGIVGAYNQAIVQVGEQKTIPAAATLMARVVSPRTGNTCRQFPYRILLTSLSSSSLLTTPRLTRSPCHPNVPRSIGAPHTQTACRDQQCERRLSGSASDHDHGEPLSAQREAA